MGARVNFAFKTDNDNYVVLYSHWGGERAVEDLSRAIFDATPRWYDNSYAVRIAISSLVGNDWASETGYGIYVNTIGDNNYPVYVVDFANQTVSVHNEIPYFADNRMEMQHTIQFVEAEPIVKVSFEQFLSNYELLKI